MRRHTITLSAAILALVVASAARAANTENDIKITTTDLTAAATYTGGAPGTSSDVTFVNNTYGTTIFTLNTANISIGTLNDLNPTQTLTINASAAHSITLNGGGDSVSSVATDLIYLVANAQLTTNQANVSLVLASNGDFDIASGGTLNLGTSVVSGNVSLNKTGTGTLTLAATNTFGSSGKTFTLTAGTVNISAAQALGNLANQIIINGGSLASTVSSTTLSTYSGGINMAGNFTLAGSVASWSLGASAVTLSNNPTITVTATSATIAGAIGGSGQSLTIGNTSTGTLVLSGTNNYSGGTTLYAGTLDVQNDSGIGSGTFTINGGTIQSGNGARTLADSVSVGGNFTVGSTNSVHLGDGTHGIDLGGGSRQITITNSSMVLYLDGQVSNGSLILAGAGRLSLTKANSFAGGLQINSGTVSFNDNAAAGTSTITINGGNVQALTSTRTLTNAVSVGGDFTINGTPSLVLNGTIDLGGTTRQVTVSSTNAATFGGTVSNGALTKAGAGTLLLSGPNTYAGGTIVNTGNVGVTGTTSTSGNTITSGPLGTGTVTLLGGGIDIPVGSSGATNVTVSNAITIGDGTHVATVSVGGNHNGSPGTDVFTISSAISLAGSVMHNISGGYKINEVFTGLISGPGGLAICNSTNTYANFSFSTGNTYSGGTIINGSNASIALGGSSVGPVGNMSSGPLGTGSITVTNGKLGAGGSTDITLHNAVTISTGATGAFSFGANSTPNIYFQGQVTLGTGLNSVSTGTGVTATFNGIISETGTDDSCGLKVTGGTLALNGANTFGNSTNPNAGGVTITGGQVRLGAASVGTPGAITSSPLGKGPLTITAGILSSDTGTSGQVRTILNAVALGGNFQVGNYQSGEKIVLTGPVTLSATPTIGMRNGGNGGTIAQGYLEIDSNLADSGGSRGLSLTYGEAPLILAGNNSYTGATTLNTGLVYAGSTTGLSPFSSFVLSNGNSSLKLNGFSNTIGSLAGSAGSVSNSHASTPATLTLGNDGTTTSFAGAIVNGSTAALALVKIGAGTQTLSGFNTYTGSTAVNQGTLAVDFTQSASAAGNQSNHLSNSSALQLNGGAVSVTGVANGVANSGKVWTGTSGNYVLNFVTLPTLVVGQTVTGTGIPASSYIAAIDTVNKNITLNNKITTGSGSDLATPVFTPTSSQTFAGTAVARGASSVLLSANGGAGTALVLGTVARSLGATVDFTPPSGTISTTNAIKTGTGTTSTILNDGGATYATVGGSDWAAKDSTNAWIVGLSTIAGGYTSSTTSILSGNADVASGVDTTLAADATTTSLRFNQAQPRTITATGFTLSTGGVLVTSAVGNNLSTITGGTLRGAPGKDLVVIQNNASNELTINSIVADNVSASGLTKSGAGTLTLGAANSFSGNTVINTGVLALTNSLALQNSALNYDSQGGTISFGVLTSVTLGGLKGAQNLALTNSSAGNVALTIGSTGNTDAAYTYTGVLSGGSGLTKAGTSNLTLSNANTYSGATTITGGGTLSVNGSILATSNVTVDSNSTLAGQGVIPGTVALSNGRLSSAGTLTLSNVTASALTSSGTSGVTAGTIALAGVATITGGTFNIGTSANLIAAGGVTVNAGQLSSTDATGIITGNVAYNSAGSSNFTGTIIGSLNDTVATSSTFGTIASATALQATYAGTTTIAPSSNITASIIRQDTLNIGLNASVKLAESGGTLIGGWPSGTDGAVSVFRNLNFDSAAKLDVFNNDLIITGMSAATVESMVRNGYSNGAWDGSSPSPVAGDSAFGKIISTDAALRNIFTLLVLDSGNSVSSFDTVTGIPAHSVIVKFTHEADLNGDGVVTGTGANNDLSLFASYYAAYNVDNGTSTQRAVTHAQGDMDFDGQLTFNDAMLFANYYNEGLAHLPEPTSLAFLALGAAGLLARKRR